MNDLNNLVKRRAANDAARRTETSKTRLLGITKTKLKTSFVGALAKFETYFGSLWGHGKPRTECTETQLHNREVWDQCRTEVLNNGNSQIRAMESELDQYTISWDRCQTLLSPRRSGV
jgi:hypothetical protein